MIVDFGKKRAKFCDDIVNTQSIELLQKYYNEIVKYQPISRDEERKLFLELKEAKDEEQKNKIKDKIVKHNLLFVVSVARTYSKRLKNTEITVEELICEGNIGLYEAIDFFKMDKDNKFISYAVWHIRKRILLFLNTNLYFSNISPHIKKKIKEINRLKSKFENENNYDVDYEYIIETFNICGERLKKSVLNALNLQTMTKLQVNEETQNLIKGDDLNEEQNLNEGNNILKKSIYELTDVNRVFISHYFGLFDYEKLSIKEIAEKYNISKNMILSGIKVSIKQLKKDSNLINYFSN